MAACTRLHQRDLPAQLATWIWNPSMMARPTEVTRFLQFATTSNLSRVYVQIDDTLGSAVWQNFISQCTNNSIAVHALLGNKRWTIGSGQPTLANSLGWIKGYQNKSPKNSSFSGIHLDVEPWNFSDWVCNQNFYIRGWQWVVQQVVDFGKSLGIPVAADLPFWVHELSTNTSVPLDSWLLGVLDSATFMTYRNTAVGVQKIADAAIQAGTMMGKPVWLAVETLQSQETNTISFYGTGDAFFEANLHDIINKYQGNNSFAGIGVHDYTGWLAIAGVPG
ncbi:hypothetical protein GQ53DRAFT_825877 [Thozetella sp. PMI_491]|nr:hypothetical protein GQ53DRAFT_825877 [Thozetella sp. PMI_491]